MWLPRFGFVWLGVFYLFFFGLPLPLLVVGIPATASLICFFLMIFVLLVPLFPGSILFKTLTICFRFFFSSAIWESIVFNSASASLFKTFSLSKKLIVYSPIIGIRSFIWGGPGCDPPTRGLSIRFFILMENNNATYIQCRTGGKIRSQWSYRIK